MSILATVRRGSQGLRGWLRFSLLRLARRWPIFADLYYMLTGAFRTEHLKTIESILAVKDRSYACKEHQLRQRIHGLEKGLTMQPRRPVFAKKWIGLIVDLYEQLYCQDNACHASCRLQKWAAGVLQEYFAAVAQGLDPVVDAARSRFAGMVNRTDGEGNIRATRLRGDAPPPVVYEDLRALAAHRGSVRQFLDRPVPREMLRQAMDVARLSPSACNRQGFEFVAIDDKACIKAVGQLDSDGGWLYERFPVLIIILGKVDAYPGDRERHLCYIDASLAAMTFQLALEAMGLGSCCLMWPEDTRREARLRHIVSFGPLDRPVMFMAVGWPDPQGKMAGSTRKDVSELLRFVGQNGNDAACMLIKGETPTVIPGGWEQ